MRIVQCCVVLALLAGLALVPRVASAQTPPNSDTLSENLVDLGTGAIVPLFAPGPVFINVPETSEPVDFVIGMPAREISFVEGPTPTSSPSDRLSIGQYNVRLASDDELTLPRRPAATLIPASALESFQPIRIEATSDGDGLTAAQSDTFTVVTGYYGPGTGTVVFTGVIPEPGPDPAPEPAIVVGIPPTFFDIEEPPAETGGVFGKISDYLDIQTTIAVRFLSSDNPADYAGLPPPNAFVFETDVGAGVIYSLDFVSDAVPEPASFALLGVALLSAGLFGYRRKTR